ncbi:chitobiase/beta-hexosaminidase C-terminal domain-containing protein [Mordavella massiliensis]|uniref:chitobiase/beta-hexosaminidase C-terminal domain-containing protein n=1 Tax=Mordavella massiliensis TaxID=1871024 RepID=UPI002108F5F7|nr:chitobiase/beta-hexosaminidase C-terminal domain-containing protein [Mordavella massiliensis]
MKASKRMAGRVLSLLLSMVMLVSLIPATAFAVTTNRTMSAEIYTGQDSSTGGFTGKTNEFSTDQEGLILHLSGFKDALPKGAEIESLAFYPTDGSSEWGTVFWFNGTEDYPCNNGTPNDKLFVDGAYNGVFQLLNFTPGGNMSLDPGTYKVMAYVGNGKTGDAYEELYYLSNETFTITGGVAESNPIVDSYTFPDGTVDVAYEANLPAVPGTQGHTLTWELASGRLPDGLSLTTVSKSAVISGMPKTEGTYKFTLKVTERNAENKITGSTSRSYSITIKKTAKISSGYAYFTTDNGGNPIAEGWGTYTMTLSGQVDTDTATATLHYNNNRKQEIELAKRGNSNTFDGHLSIPAAATVLNKVVFTADGVEKPLEYEIKKGDVQPCVEATVSGVPSGSSRRLVLQKKAGNTWEYEKTVDSWARSGDVDVVSGLESGETYRLALVSSQFGREIEYGTSEELTGITGRQHVEVAYAERTVTTVKPQVYAGENKVSSSYTLNWYDAKSGGNLVATGSSHTFVDGDDPLWVEAVPTRSYALYYLPSARVQADGTDSEPVLTMSSVPTSTVTGTVTLDGEPVEWARVTVSVTTGDGYAATYRGTADENGAFTIKNVPLSAPDNEFLLTATHASINDWTYDGLTAENCENIEIKAKRRTGMIQMPGLYGTITVTDTEGKEVPVRSQSSDAVYLEADKVSAGQTVTLHSDNNDRYIELPVTLDDNKCAAVTETGTWMYRDHAIFKIGNNKLASKILCYDKDGRLCYECGINNVINFSGPYQEGGTYTWVFASTAALGAVSYTEKSTLAGLKKAVNAGCYQTVDVTLEEPQAGSAPKAKTTDVELTLQSLINNMTDIDASGLTMSADAETIDFRVTAAAKEEGLKQKKAIICVDVNNTSRSISDSGTPDVVNGSVYINGHKAGEDIVIYPNESGHVRDFKGDYSITIPDVETYGGWPLVVQFQAKRVNMGNLTATASLKDSYGDKVTLGQADLSSPAISLYAPAGVNQDRFSVYGLAPGGKEVSLYLDGELAATVTAQENGYYTAELDLGEPYIYEEYTLSAMVETDGQTISSRTVDLCYNSTLPSLYEILATDYRKYWFTLWKDGQAETGYYYYMPNTPMRFSASFTDSNGNRITDANAMEEVYVHVPRSDGVVTLKAEYDSSLNAWVTEEYKCGNNPPQNTWVSYTPATPGLAATAQDLERADAAQANVDPVTEGDVADYTEDFKNMGVSVTWDEDGTPESMTIPANGNTYTITSSTTQGGAAAAIADLPKWEEEPVVADHDKTGATYIVPSGNVVYARVSGPDEAELKYDYIESYDLPDGDQFVVRTTVTADQYTQVYYDTAADDITTVTYKAKNKNTLPEGDYKLNSDRIVDLAYHWATVAYDMDNLQTAQTRTLSKAARSESAYRYTGNHEIDTYAQLLQFYRDNGVTVDGEAGSGGTDTWWEYVVDGGGDGTLGSLHSRANGGKANQRLSNALFKQLGSDIKSAVSGGKDIYQKGPQVAIKKIREMLTKQTKNQLKQRYGKVKDSEEILEAKREAYQFAADLKKKGRDVDFTNLPPIEGLMDPRDWGKDKDYQDAFDDDSGGGGDDSGEGGDSSGSGDSSGGGGGGFLDGYGDGGSGGSSSGGSSSSGSYGNYTVEVPNTRKAIIDPSGYVYAGVESNRVEGADATVYEVAENTGTRTLWNAEAFDQSNPYITGADGFYQWMVPSGLWSVSVAANGYDAYTTGEKDGTDAKEINGTWAMPVAPVQLDVNIDLQASAAPTVESVQAAGEGVYIVFDQYMNTDTLTAEQFVLLVNGEKQESEVSYPDAEKNGGKTYARTVMLTGAAYTGEDSIYLRVEPNVESYTGKEMDFSYEERDIPVVALQKAETPAADPGSGSVEVNTAVTLTTATEGAKIFYTTDGSEPDLTSKLYTGPILITAETVIKAIAVKAGMTNSDVAAFTYTVEVSGDDQPGTNPGEDEPGSDPGEDDPGEDDPGTDPGEDQPGTDPGEEQPGIDPGGDQPDGDVTAQEPDKNTGDVTSPQSGDSSNVLPWIILLILSGGGIGIAYKKNKRNTRNR